MTKTFEAHFDGKSLVPEGAVDLPQDQRPMVRVERLAADEPAHGTVAYFLEHFKDREISDENAERMKAAIEDACERIDIEPSVDFGTDTPGHERRD